MSKRLLTIVLATAVAASLVFIPLTAGSQEGRSDGAQPGPATAPEASPAAEATSGWDGDGPAPRDQVILDDLIVDGSICAGFDCVNGESFGFDTLRLKENNLRINFEDTSTSASFPSNDWMIKANETSNGGANEFVISDDETFRDLLTLEAGAPNNALYLDSSGKFGIRKANPVTDIHIVSGNTPTLRLEQDGSNGFTPQTWDLAGNEANFFIRDATNGSTLPFRIKPGAPSNVLYIGGNGATFGAAADASEEIDVRSTTPRIQIVDTDNGGSGFRIGNSGNDDFLFQDVATNNVFFRILKNSTVRLNPVGTAPTGAAQGDLYYDNSGTLCVFDGTNWLNTTANGDCT